MTRMQRITFVALSVVLTAIVTVAQAPGAGATQDSRFAGVWTSVDNDGSHQTLRIAGSGHGALAMFLFDDSATGACDGLPAHVVGSGRPVGDIVVMKASLVCLPGGNPIRHRINLVFELVNGALVDETGVVWGR